MLPEEPGIVGTSGDVDVSARLSPEAGKVMGEGASDAWIPDGEPADPNDTGESGKQFHRFFSF